MNQLTSQPTPQPTFTALPHLAALHVSGPDAEAFLQAQVPSDVRLLNPQRAQLSGWCTAKGRLLTTFVLWPVADGYRLILAKDVAEAVAKRLKMFVLRLKVQITLTDDAVAGLLNPAPTLGELALPSDVWQVAPLNACTAIRIDESRLLLCGPSAALTTLQTQAASATPDDWLRADIEHGFPLVSAATSEHYVPQMINLDKLGGVSFKKGCYPGQEIVARTHYLGKIKRHLYRLQAAQALAAGSEIRATLLNGQTCGSILSAAPTADGSGWLALAVLQQDAANGEIYIEAEAGRLVLTLIDKVMPTADDSTD